MTQVNPNRLSIPLTDKISPVDLRMPKPIGVLVVEVIEAKDLPRTDVGFSKCDPYVIISHGRNEKRTRCVFHQHFIQSFFEHRSQKLKKDSQVLSFFCTFRVCAHKKLRVKSLVRLTPGFNFTNNLHAAFTFIGPKSTKRH